MLLRYNTDVFKLNTAIFKIKTDKIEIEYYINELCDNTLIHSKNAE